MENFFSMKAGVGDSSYAQNSKFLQKSVLLGIKSLLEESIQSWEKTFQCKTLCLADLGCSSGPNADFIAQIIIKAMRDKYAGEGIAVPEIHYAYNDLPFTDFNSLFRNLPPWAERSYLVAGVPGSFYTRLFPLTSLHFVHCSFGLHWLSQMPKEIEDKNTDGWNKGRIYISEEGPDRVAEAYFLQFQKDFNAFLTAREKEMVIGGRIFVVVSARYCADRRKQGFPGFFWETLGYAFNELVFQGVIDEEKVDSFNIPFYAASADELRSEVQKEGSFSIVRRSISNGPEKVDTADKDAYAIFLSKQVKAISESLIAYHFGEGVIDALFRKYAETFRRRMTELMEVMQQECQLVLVLERSSYDGHSNQ